MYLLFSGWLNRDIVDDFAAYARVCFEELGPDVSLVYIFIDFMLSYKSCYS